jgi:hypothetical protein
MFNKFILALTLGGMTALPPLSTSYASALIAVNLTIINGSSNNATIYWKNPAGQMIFYKNLAAGESYLQPTYSTHEWVAVFDNGTSQNFIMPNQDMTWTIR